MNIKKEKWVIDSGTNENKDLFIWKASKYGEYYGSGAIATVHGDKAIARLIVEAGTIANKTGLMPKELLKQRDELLDACKRDAMLADQAILRTPTSPLRNKLTEINILRLAAIDNVEASK